MTKRSQFIFSCGPKQPETCGVLKQPETRGGPNLRETCVLGLAPAKRFIKMLHPSQSLLRLKVILEETRPSGFNSITKFIQDSIKFGHFESLTKLELINFGSFQVMDIGLRTMAKDRLSSLECLNVEMLQIVGSEVLMSRLRRLKLINTQSLSEVIGCLSDKVEKICIRGMDLSRDPTIFSGFSKLRKVCLNGCQMNAFPIFHDQLRGLYFLSLQQNKLTDIPRQGIPESILHLNLACNNLTAIDHIPRGVVYVDISYNRLTRLPCDMLLCHKLLSVRIHDNPLMLSVPHKRFLKDRGTLAYFEVDKTIRRLKNACHEQHTQPGVENMKKKPSNMIYEDKQNVHNHDIQRSVLESACNLFIVETNTHLMFHGCGNREVDLILLSWFRDKTQHSVLLVTLLETFFVVWKRIQDTPDAETRAGLLSRLYQEVIDGHGMCFTGKITRLVNVLVGFFKDIKVQISSSDQIYARMLKHREKYGKIDREILEQELSELDVAPQTVRDWISTFEENL